MLEEKVSCAILCGGKSSRMGQDKALMPFGNAASLTEFQLNKFSGFFDEIYLSSKAKKLDLMANWIYDDSKISAPIVALIEILKTIRSDRVFVLAVDVPFFGVNEAKKLLEKQADIVMARSISGVHPLAAVYSKTVLDLMIKKFNNGEYSLQKLALETDLKTVDFDETYLQNLNYIKEYQKAYENSSCK